MSIALASIFLAASLGITVITHFCGGKAVGKDINLFSNHFGCKMESTCGSNCEVFAHSVSKRCCENSFLNLELPQEFRFRVVKLVQNPPGVAPLMLTYVSKIDMGKVRNKLIRTKDPPIPLEDFLTLFQQFLI